MNNFLAMLDKLAQRPSLTDARVRVFKLETNPEAPANLPAPERLPLEQTQAAGPGQSAVRRKRRHQL